MRDDDWAPTVLRPPSSRLRRAANLLDRAVGQLLAARDGLDPALGQFEATHDSLNLLYLCVRHVDAVVALATQDAVLGPAAITLARGAFESCIRALWLVDADDLYEREGRWLGLLGSDVDTRTRFVRHAQADLNTEEAAADQHAWATSLKKHHDAFQKLLAAKGHRPVAVPKMDAIIKATKLRTYTTYLHYMLGSQYSHGTLWATWSFRGQDWQTRSGSERPDESAWTFALGMCRAALLDPAPRVLVRLGVRRKIYDKNIAGQLQRAIAAMSTAKDRAV